ncbi:MAG: FAD-dependent oxidoreductase, partial [Limisphaerales bacterium]
MQTQFNFTKVLIIASIAILPTFNKAAAATVLVEAENFEEYGGWKLDTQFIEIMGSPYLIAHGLGKPVQDAITTVRFPKAGNYRVFVRTKDWVARWNAPGTPGRFQLLINGKPLDEMFGTKGADWFWHYGGEVKITNKTATIALHDLSGFDGRCDAIIFTDEPNYTPPNDATPNADWRLKLAGKKIQPADAGHFDFVVVGGGYAGMCAAISAARMGCKVALIQDRPVLGGNGSSEIRVWPQGGTRRGLFPRLGEIVEELVDRPKQSPGSDQEFNDERREAIV